MSIPTKLHHPQSTIEVYQPIKKHQLTITYSEPIKPDRKPIISNNWSNHIHKTINKRTNHFEIITQLSNNHSNLANHFESLFVQIQIDHIQ